MKAIKGARRLGITPVSSIEALGITPIRALGLSSFKNEDNYKNEFYGLKKGEGINLPKLLNYLKFGQKGTLCYWRFKGTPTKERDVVISYGVVETGRILNSTAPFTYKNEYKQKIETGIRCAINTKEDYILNVPHFSMDLDFNKKSSIGRIVYFFAGTEDYRKEALLTSDKTDFTINEKYVAINFFSENLNDMAFLAKELYGDAEWYKNLVNEQYIPLLENAKYVEELIWLYENAPDFTLVALKPETLWKHICQFYSYDTSGTFSFLKDASPQLMRALFAFNSIERIVFLMKKLNENQAFVSDLYEALDDEIAFMGKKMPCKIAFISVLSSFATLSKECFNFTNEFFVIGKESRVVLEKIESSENKSDKGKYKVEQKIKTGTGLTSAGGVSVPYDIYEIVNAAELFPLDMVTVLQDETQSLLSVPVLFLENEQYQKNMEGLTLTLRLGVDMLAIALAIETLGASLLAKEATIGGAFFATLGAIDGAIALGDIGVQLNKDKLSKEFLEKWEKIYFIGGIATASPLVVASLYKLGGRILASSAKAEVKNFVQSCMMKMILESEISNFTKNTLKIANEETIAKASEFFFDKHSFKHFWEQGCQLAYGEVKIGKDVQKEIILIYKGVPILEGSAKELRPKLMELYTARANQSVLEKLLENLYKLTPKLDQTKRFWTCFNEAGAELKWGKLSTKHIEQNIESAIKNADAAIQWEGEVAKAFAGIDEVKQVGTKVEYRNNGMSKFELAGDYDVLTEKYLVECKKSVSHNALTHPDFIKQFEKYINPKNSIYINIGNKKVVLFIKDLGQGVTPSHKIFKLLENKGVKVITNINDIKYLK